MDISGLKCELGGKRCMVTTLSFLGRPSSALWKPQKACLCSFPTKLACVHSCKDSIILKKLRILLGFQWYLLSCWWCLRDRWGSSLMVHSMTGPSPWVRKQCLSFLQFLDFNATTFWYVVVSFRRQYFVPTKKLMAVFIMISALCGVCFSPAKSYHCLPCLDHHQVSGFFCLFFFVCLFVCFFFFALSPRSHSLFYCHFLHQTLAREVNTILSSVQPITETNWCFCNSGSRSANARSSFAWKNLFPCSVLRTHKRTADNSKRPVFSQQKPFAFLPWTELETDDMTCSRSHFLNFTSGDKKQLPQ